MSIRDEARTLRASGLTVADVAVAVGAPKGTVYGWVRDIPGPPRELWRPAVRRTKGSLHARKLAEIAECEAWARERVAALSDDAFFAAGIALYIGEGHKRDGCVGFTNTNRRVIQWFISWLRTYFEIDESRLRARLYLHQGLDLDAAIHFWSTATGIPAAQFGKPYRAKPDPSIRSTKHPMGCLTINYGCSRTHRRVMALAEGLLSSLPHDPA